MWWVSFQACIQLWVLFRCLYWVFELFKFNGRLFFQTKNQSLIWKKWDILGHMVWMLCINTSTVVWITPTSPNMSCNPSGLASLLSFHYGCRKFKPGFCFTYECYAWLQFRINLLYLFRTSRFWVWLVAELWGYLCTWEHAFLFWYLDALVIYIWCIYLRNNFPIRQGLQLARIVLDF